MNERHRDGILLGAVIVVLLITAAEMGILFGTADGPGRPGVDDADTTLGFQIDSIGRGCEMTTDYYRVNFVVGGPFATLQGPVEANRQHALTRFVGKYIKTPAVTLSDVEFITDPKLAERIEYQPIVVENDTAMVTFRVVNGSTPITLSLVSFTTPGPGSNRPSGRGEPFVHVDSNTFDVGGPYTLRVVLPDARVGSCETSDSGTITPVNTRSPQPTTPADTPTATDQPTQTPTPTPSVPTLDLRVVETGRSIPFEFDQVLSGDKYHVVVQLRNVGIIPGNYLCAEVTNVDGAENVRLEPERDPGVQNGPGSELPKYLDIRMAYSSGGTYHWFYSSTPITAENTRRCAVLTNALVRGSPVNFHITVEVASEGVNSAMSDSATFDVVLTLYSVKPGE